MPRSSAWIAAFANYSMLVLIVAMTVIGVHELIGQLPPPPPTPAESAEARPAAAGTWVLVSGKLQARFPDRPLETGEVWSTRTGRVCGFVNRRRTNSDDMERFFTTPNLEAHFQDEDIYAFMPVWKACLDDRWVVLHEGVEDTGFCASAHARSSRIAQDILCVGWRPDGNWRRP